MQLLRLVFGLTAMAICVRAQVTGEGSYKGSLIYQSQCGSCHGPNGEGGRGSPLNRAKLRHAPDDESLQRVIRRGIPGTGMPSSALSDSEIREVILRVRAFGKRPVERAAGNAERGRQLYASLGCGSCHMINGYGGSFGTDLSDIGASRSVAHLRASLTNPDEDISAGYVSVRAVPSNGSAVAGVRVNEDTFSIQIRDPQGRIHSFWKHELKSLNKDLKKSSMPSFAKSLSVTQLDDLAAYLGTLREDQAQ